MKRDEQRNATRQGLAEAALGAFLDRGLEAVTVEEIAAAAGVSPRTFFLHFASKAAAVFPDHDDNLHDFRAALAALPTGTDDVVGVCDLVVQGVRQQSASTFRRRRYDLVHTVPAVRDVDARTDRDYEDAVAEHLRGRWGDDPDAVLAALVVANIVIGVARAALVCWGRDGSDPVESTRRLLDRLLVPPLHGLAGRTPAGRDLAGQGLGML